MTTHRLEEGKKASPGQLSIPFLTTPFAWNFAAFLMLWPLWWLLGLEQFVAPGFVFWEAGRVFWKNNGRFRANRTFWIAFFLAVWWIVPVFWVPSGKLDVFVKQTVTIWTLVLLLGLFLTEVRREEHWWLIGCGVNYLAIYTAVSAWIFTLGLWRGQIKSGLGLLLPQSLLENSAFFESVGFRSFGGIDASVFLTSFRLSGFALEYGGLGSVIVVLFPFSLWYFSRLRGVKKIAYVGVISGLFITIIFVKVRLVILAFLVGATLYVALTSSRRLRDGPILVVMGGLLALAALVLAITLAYEPIFDFFQAVFMEWRRGSWNVRMVIYRETLRLLPQHWLTGWGVSVPIPGLRIDFSAGTHNSLLGILFQQGVVGLGLYISLWASIWFKIYKGIKRKQAFYSFWVMVAVAMIAFNVREMGTTWWWDQTTTISLWTMWGLVITAARFDNRKSLRNQTGNEV